MLATLHRVSIDAHQTEQRRRCRADAIPQSFAIFHRLRIRRREGRQDRDRHTSIGAGRVDSEIGCVFEARDAFAILLPTTEALLPQLSLLCGEGFRLQTLITSLIGVQPRLEILRAQLWEREQQVAEIALGIDDDGRNAIDRRFLQQPNT